MSADEQLLARLLAVLEAFEKIQLRLDPSRLPEYQQQLRTLEDITTNIEVADTSTSEQNQLVKVSKQLSKGLEQFLSAGDGQAGMMKAFRSLRFICRALEALYPLAEKIDQVNQFFGGRNIPFLNHDDDISRGILNANNERGQRGGFHFYVPEYYQPEKKWPMIVALHGGSGHGADFFWSWLTDARARGCLLLSPSSKGNTWSLNKPAVDTAALLTMLKHLSDNWNVDSERILVTGLSDGGTFAMMAGMLEDSPYTHIAPIASAAHAFTGQPDVAERFKGKRIYMVHGARDWMFPVVNARQAAEELENAGAEIVYREIADLSHNYPRDENATIIEWLMQE